MDKNKLKVLQDLPYKIKAVCGNCIHADLKEGVRFGTCKITSYEHLKHSAETSQLSIYKFGSCPKHEFGDQYEYVLGAWAEFRE